MATVNEKLQDSTIRHNLEIQRYSNGVVNRVIKLLNKVDIDITAQLAIKLQELPDSPSVARIDAILKSVRELNKEAYATISNELDIELRDFTAYEAGYQYNLFTNTLPVQVSFATVNAEQAYSAAMSRPFQGKLLKEWMSGLETDKAVRIRDAIRMGYVENETIAQIVKRVRGTKANNYKDGILEINKRNAETIVRTAIGHTAQFTRQRFFEANDEVIKAIKWNSTLDGRTTEICMLRDNKLYTPVTHKPIGHQLPYHGGAGNAHFGCRSVFSGVTKSWRELGIDADELPASTRASMNGQVPDDMSYGDWLRKQDADFQDGVLGKTKGKLFREGGLSIEQFANNKGQSYTLKQLREIESQAFKKAGLDTNS